MAAMTLSVRVTLPDQAEISRQDVDRVVATLKRDLTWGFLKRQLLEDNLDGRTALALSERALDIHARTR
jgi:hypothetical protein